MAGTKYQAVSLKILAIDILALHFTVSSSTYPSTLIVSDNFVLTESIFMGETFCFFSFFFLSMFCV